MKKKIVLILLIVLGVFILGYFLFVECNRCLQKPKIPIEARSDLRIVYTTSQSINKNFLMEDCEGRGGRFNECGPACAETDCPLTVCAFTCELSSGKMEQKTEATLDISDWKTYRNEKYEFELSYPADFTKQKTVSDANLLSLKRTEAGSDIYLNVNLKKNYQIDRILSSVEAKKIKIGGQQGYKYFFREGAGYSGVALIQLEQDVLEFIYDCIGGKNKETFVKNAFVQILSTFKFIDDKQPDDKQPWEDSVCGNGVCEPCESSNECCNYPCQGEVCPPPTCLGWCPQDCVTELIDCTKEGEILSLEEGSEGLPCCEGINQKVHYDLINNECAFLADAAICINCPNGVCGLGENRCNCPEDCS